MASNEAIHGQHQSNAQIEVIYHIRQPLYYTTYLFILRGVWKILSIWNVKYIIKG